MLDFLKRRKAEKVLKELVELLGLSYGDLNKSLVLSEAQKQKFLKTDILEQHVIITEDANHNFHITSFGLLNTICKVLTNQKLYFVVEDPSDENSKIIDIFIKK